MKIKLLFLMLAFALTSCFDPNKVPERENPNDSLAGSDNDSFDFEVPDQFDWENFQTISCAIKVHNRYDEPVEYGVEIYDGEDLINAGITKNGIYVSLFIVEKGVENLTVVQKDPSGATAKVNVAVNGTTLNYDFSSMVEETPSKSSATRAGEDEFSAPAAPTIPAEAIEVTEGMILEENGVYRISAGSVINDVQLDKVSGVHIYIEGEYNIPSSLWLSGGKDNFEIYVLEGGKFVSNGNIYADNHKNLKIVNYGEFITTGSGSNLHINGEILNAGKMSLGEGEIGVELFLLQGSLLENYGELTSCRLGLTAGAVLKNYGDIRLSQDVWCQPVKIDGEYVHFELFENRGSFVAEGQIQLTGGAKVDNYSSLESKGTINIHSIGELAINSGSMLKGNKIYFDNSKVVSKGDAIIKVGNTLHIDPTSQFVGDSETPSVIWAPDGYSENSYIAIQSSITGKWVIDPDPKIHGKVWPEDVVLGDMGYVVPDNPNNDGGYNADKVETPDPLETIAFETTPKVVVFEDNYPDTGDYDLNDVVMQWNLRGTKDANDIVKDLYVDVTVKACGARGYTIGAAVRVHSMASQVASAAIEADASDNHLFGAYFAPVNGVEPDANGVVVPLFENVHVLFGLDPTQVVNVLKSDTNRADFYKFSVKLEFAGEVKGTDLNLDNFDFFIVTSVKNGGRTEIHTYGNDVSLLANNTITFKDPSAIWGLELPKDFLYPYEATSILDAYTKFQPWVQSNGVEQIDWYKFPEEGLVFPNND